VPLHSSGSYRIRRTGKNLRYVAPW
jgi:hypothetical protein